MSDAYAYASNGPIEPFWHRDRINRLFLLPLDKTVLTRIGGLSAAFVASFALLLFGGFGVVLLAGGRPPCPFCGQPLEPTGHFCLGGGDGTLN